MKNKEYKTLEIETKGNVSTIWMDRPKVFNAFDEELINEISQACEQLENDDATRVVVLAGRGKHFSAGADLNWMKRASNAGEEKNLEDARIFANMLRKLSQLKKPTIARVQGLALGGGTGLAAACDITIASDDAYFATSEVKFGIIPSVISPFVLRAIGPRHASRYFLSAERFSAQKAYHMGLVSEVVSVEDLDTTVQKIVKTLGEGGPEAQSAAKELIVAISGRKINQEISEETAKRIANQRKTSEAKDGISAFLEKRSPKWLNN